MKKTYILLCALAAASCTEKEEFVPTGELVTREFSTVLTKTTLHTDGATVYWEDDDAISIFDGTGNNKFDIKDYSSPSASATFSGEVDAGATEFYAVYPYDAGNILAGSTLTATVPASQTLETGSFQSGAAVAVAYTTSNSLDFHQATAILKITLADYMNNVERIEFSGNNDEYVAGAFDVAMNSSGEITSITPGTGSKNVALTGTFAAGEAYYLSFIPQTFSAGLTVTVTYGGGQTAVATSSKSFPTEAGVSYPIADFSRVALPVASFTKKSFNYDEGTPQELPVTCTNVTSLTIDDVPEGWTVVWDTDHFNVTPPTLTQIQATPQTVAPAGVIEATITSPTGYTGNLNIPVRLYGINSVADWNDFRTAYVASNSGIGTYASDTYNDRTAACADYMIEKVVTINADIDLPKVNNYYFHNFEHSINGNNRTLKLNINASGWPVGFCQQAKGTPTISDLKLDGTINWTFAGTAANNGQAGVFAARCLDDEYAKSISFINVKNSVDITWTTTAPDNTLKHLVGGFIGWSNVPISFENSTYSGTIRLTAGGYVVGGFIALASKAPTFEDCHFGGTIDFTSYTATPTDNKYCGNIGGYIGEVGTDNVICTFTGCDVTLEGRILSNTDVSCSGGFVGQAGGNSSEVNMSNCAFHGILTHTSGRTKGRRRIGGFVGDAARIVTLTNCINDGTMNCYENGFSVVCFGGIIGYTTNQSGTVGSPHTMRTTLTSCSFSGTMNVYCKNESNLTNLKGKTNVFGTLIGNNTGYPVTSIDGSYQTSNKSVNYGTTTVNFTLEP